MRVVFLFVATTVLLPAVSLADGVPWSGLYAGVAGGALLSRAAGTNSGTAEFGNLAILDTVFYDNQPFNSAPHGFFVGGQIGYNWRQGSFVLGLELDGQWSNASAGPMQDFINERRALPWLASGRARIGYANDAWLLFATGGLAFGAVEYQFVPSFDGLPQEPTTEERSGWAAGAGAELALVPSVSTKLEYLFVDLGEEATISAGRGQTPDWGYTSFSNANKSNITEHLVRFGLNLQLD
jgi:outer membrane immunogenic protein